jgi:hypothetical protein
MERRPRRPAPVPQGTYFMNKAIDDPHEGPVANVLDARPSEQHVWAIRLFHPR